MHVWRDKGLKPVTVSGVFWGLARLSLIGESEGRFARGHPEI